MQDHLQTMAYAYQEICQGEEPWIALGNFMNAWYGDAKNQRIALIKDPLTIPEQMTPELHQWATFIAASVEWFSQTYDLPCPTWVQDPKYSLTEAWFFSYNGDQEAIRQRLIKDTPEPFKRRNIYCGNRMYNNKYELSELTAKIREIRAKKLLQNLAY